MCFVCLPQRGCTIVDNTESCVPWHVVSLCTLSARHTQCISGKLSLGLDVGGISPSLRENPIILLQNDEGGEGGWVCWLRAPVGDSSTPVVSGQLSDYIKFKLWAATAPPPPPTTAKTTTKIEQKKKRKEKKKQQHYRNNTLTNDKWQLDTAKNTVTAKTLWWLT